MPYRPPAASGPKKRRRPPAAPRSPALATRESGIGTQPKQTAPRTRGPKPVSQWTPAQRRAAQKLISSYESGPRIGNLGRALDRAGKVYEDNPISRNPIVGRKGLLGGIEDLVKTTDPIALGQTLAKTARHPLASRSATGLNAGIVVGGPGGFRPGKAPAEITRPRTRIEAEARLSELDKQQERFHKALVGKHKSVLLAEQARLNAAKGLARKAAKSTKPIKGGKRAARVEQPQGTVADAFLQRTVDEAVAKHPEHPAVKAYLSNIDEANQLRESLNAQHLPGEGPGLPLYRGTHPGEGALSTARGHFFASTDEATARQFASGRNRQSGRVVPFHLSSDARVLRVTRDELPSSKSMPAELNRIAGEAKSKGYDAVVFPDQAGEGVAILNDRAIHRPPDYGQVRVPAPARTRGTLNPQQLAVQEKFVAGVEGAGRRPPPREPGPPAPPAGGEPPLPGIERTPEEAARVVASELGAARRGYATQKAGYSVERTERVARGLAARESAGGGIAGQRAFLREQRGALPKETFDRLQKRQLTHTDLENLTNRAWEHPDLEPWDKANAVDALLKAVEERKQPAPHEIELLRRAYGEPVAKVLAKPSLLQRGGKLASELVNSMRAIMTTLDVSFGGRQALMAGVMHPRIWGKTWPKSLRSFASEAYAHKLDAKIRADPNYELALKHGVPFTHEGGPLAGREEAHISTLPEKIPVFGRAVKASNRAYVAFGNAMRMGMFNRQLELARRQGRNVESVEQLRNISNLVGNATGRGTLGPMEPFAPALNVGLFAPRLIASRVNFLNPIWYAKRDRFARVQALKGLIGLAGAGSAVLGLAHIAGAKVGLDPTNADFAKIRVKNSRVDIFGGFQQYIRLASQIQQGHITSSTTGRELTLGPGYGQLNKKDILERFAVGKFNPPASLVYDYFKGTDFQGKPFSWKKATLQRLIPLVVQDTADVYHGKDSIPAAALTYAIAAVGVGMQNYGNPVTEEASKKLRSATQHQNVHLDNLVKSGVLPRKQRDEYREALTIYDKRNQLNTSIDAATKDKPLTRERQKMAGLLSLLGEHKLLRPAELKRYRQHYATADLTPKELSADRAWFWRNSGVGPMLTWYRDKAGASD